MSNRHEHDECRKIWGRLSNHHHSTSSTTIIRSSNTDKRSLRTISTTDSKNSDNEDDESSIASVSSLSSAKSSTSTSNSRSTQRQQQQQARVPATVIAEQSSPACSPIHSPNSECASTGTNQNDEDDASKNESCSREFSKLLCSAEAALNARKLRDGLSWYGQAVDLLRRNPECGDETITIANLCYTCSRIARRLGDYEAAYRYGTLELAYVKDCASLEVVASNHYDLAHLCHYELGDSGQALEHFQTAYGLLQIRLQNIRKDIAKCPHCKSFQVKALCTDHKAIATEMKANLQETKQCIGRIQFGMGMVADAMTML